MNRINRIKYRISKAKLEYLHLKKELTIKEIAKELDVCSRTIASRFKYFGINLKLWRPKGEKANGWNNGRYKSDGYIYIYNPSHNRACRSRKNYVAEHILVWEKEHNKLLPKDWLIHHRNGIKDDNRPENLLALPIGKHKNIIPELCEKIEKLEKENTKLKKKVLSYEDE